MNCPRYAAGSTLPLRSVLVQVGLFCCQHDTIVGVNGFAFMIGRELVSRCMLTTCFDVCLCVHR